MCEILLTNSAKIYIISALYSRVVSICLLFYVHVCVRIDCNKLKHVFFPISVAITSCARKKHLYSANRIIKFSAVKLSKGIENVNEFQSSGIFTSKKQGIYLVGVHILSYNRYASFVIIKNGRELSRVHVRTKLRSTYRGWLSHRNRNHSCSIGCKWYIKYQSRLLWNASVWT